MKTEKNGSKSSGIYIVLLACALIGIPCGILLSNSVNMYNDTHVLYDDHADIVFENNAYYPIYFWEDSHQWEYFKYHGQRVSFSSKEEAYKEYNQFLRENQTAESKRFIGPIALYKDLKNTIKAMLRDKGA